MYYPDMEIEDYYNIDWDFYEEYHLFSELFYYWKRGYSIKEISQIMEMSRIAVIYYLSPLLPI